MKLFALIQIDKQNYQLEGAQFCIHAWTLNNQPLLNIFEQSALSYIYLRKQWGNILIRLMIYTDWCNDLYWIMNSDMIFWGVVISRSGPIARANQAVNRITEHKHNIKEKFQSRKTSKYCWPWVQCYQLSHVNHHILVHVACLVFSTCPITPKTTTLNEGGLPQNSARNQEDLHLSPTF